jgi:hypothetical protein
MAFSALYFENAFKVSTRQTAGMAALFEALVCL